jgi:hypothetical protein
MVLYLHIGTNKTGSSFLQTMLGRNRALLAEKGILFPLAEREEDMLSGKISPGNGGQLCINLVSANEPGVTGFFKHNLINAQKAGFTAVLFSNEKLIRALSHPGALKMMVDAAFNAGFTEINVLSIFRDPVDHALSLYQHRAKDGLHSDFNQWLLKDYETIRMLKNFLPQIQQVEGRVKWTFRKYKSDPKAMLDLLFKNWLNIQVPDVNSLPAVNPSLSLSEINLLQSIRNRNPLGVKPLKMGFDNLSKHQKADDTLIRQHLRVEAYHFIKAHQGIFDTLNTKMPDGENLLLLPEEMPLEPLKIYFSPEQEAVISSAKKHADGLKYKLKEQLALGIKTLKRKFFLKAKIRDMYNLEP